MARFTGKKIAFVVGDYFEQVEFTEPCHFLEQHGAKTVLFAPKLKEVHGMKHAELGDEFQVDKPLSELNVAEYDGVVWPGGVISADQLRMDQIAQQKLSHFLEARKMVAIICHAPWVLISAGKVKGRRLTSYFTLQDDIKNAGGDWVDQAVVVDDNLITSRNPDDIPAFNKAIAAALSAQ